MGCAGAGLPHLTQAQPCPRLCQPPGLGTRQLSRPPSLIQCQGGQGVFLLSWFQGDGLGSAPHPFSSQHWALGGCS